MDAMWSKVDGEPDVTLKKELIALQVVELLGARNS